MMNIKTFAVPLFVALSLIFGACAEQTEAPNTVDDTVQEGVEGTEQGADDAGDAIEEGADDAGNAVEEGAEDTGDAVDGMGDETPAQ
ncbi:MAG TPA: hypothetical protein V6C71_26590 [Coleofasciculaceae cyanobacterium]|jgi:hypothetical protein